MSERRWPRRWEHEEKEASFAYVEQLGPSERIYAYHADGSPCLYVEDGKTIHSSFDCDNGDFFAERGVWIETFDHHKDENGMYQHFLAAGPSPANSEVAYLRAEVERLTKERDAWIETARQHLDNEFFYKGLLTQIGDMFGIEAKTSDDGSVQDSVIALKVPELVERLNKERDAITNQLECEKASSAHRWELATKYSGFVGKIREGLGNEARRFPSCKLPEFAESLRKERDELREQLGLANDSIRVKHNVASDKQQLLDRCKVRIDELHAEVNELRTKLAEVEARGNAKAMHSDELASELSRKTYLADFRKKEVEQLAEQLAESEAAAAKMREALQSIVASDRWMVGHYESNGPAFTGKNGYEYADQSSVIESANERIEKADLALSTTAGREFLAEREKMREEIESLKSQLAGERGRVEGLKEGCEILKRQLAEAEKQWMIALADIDTIGQRLTLPPDSTVERILEEIDHIHEKARTSADCLTTPLSMPERAAYESRANEYRAELQRQLNEAWMRQAFNDADRIADLLGVPKPSDHEKADLQPAAVDSEWPEVWERTDVKGQTVTLNGYDDKQRSVRRDGSRGMKWSRSELIDGSTVYKLVSKGGKAVE